MNQRVHGELCLSTGSGNSCATGSGWRPQGYALFRSIPEDSVKPECSQSTVYFDGSCPLCLAEISYYRRTDHAESLCFVDVSKSETPIPAGLAQQDAMERFHVRAANGQMLSGAAAFVEIWARLPGWRWVARAAALPGAMPILELGYRLFLPVRPVLSRVFGKMQRLRQRIRAPRTD